MLMRNFFKKKRRLQHTKMGKIIQVRLIGGIPTPLKNMKVSWDDDIPNIWKNNPFMFQTTNQPLIFHYQRVNHH
jgi:hypothetical protein